MTGALFSWLPAKLGLVVFVAEPNALARLLVALGGWGYLAVIVSYTLLQSFGVPGPHRPLEENVVSDP